MAAGDETTRLARRVLENGNRWQRIYQKCFKSANCTAFQHHFGQYRWLKPYEQKVKSRLSQLSTKLCVFASVSWRHPFNIFCCDTWTLLGGIRIVISIHQNSPGGYSGGISSRSSLVPNGITMSALGNKNRNAAVFTLKIASSSHQNMPFSGRYLNLLRWS